jgi:hypothetical protein
MKFSNRIFINLLFITFLFNNCANDLPKITEKDGVVYVQNSNKGLWNNSKKMVLTKIFTIGENNNNENYDFAVISDIIVDSKGNIYVCDSKDHCIKVYSARGKYIKSIGEKGEGPGELSGPMHIQIDNQSNVYISEAWNRRISIFDKKGEFLSTVKYRMNSVTDMLVEPNTGDIFLAERLKIGTEPKHVIYKYTKEGKLIKSFCKPFVIGETIIGKNYAPVNLCYLPNSHILSFARYPYELRIFTTNGDLVKVISKKSQIFTTKTYSRQMSNDLPFESLLPRGMISNCLIMPNGNSFVRIVDLGGKFLEDYEKHVRAMQKQEEYNIPEIFVFDYLDSDGNFLQTFDDPFGGGKIEFLDSQNNIFVSSKKNDIPIVEKYKIEFKDKN